MKAAVSRSAGVVLALGALLACMRSWEELSRRRNLLEYHDVARIDYRQEGDDPEATVRARIALATAALGRSTVVSEVRTALALERLNSASARLLSGGANPQDEAEVTDRLAAALGEVRLALRANPTDTKAWLAGYRVLASARLLGRDEEVVAAGPAGDRSPPAPRDGPPSVPSDRPEVPAASAAFLDGAIRTNPNSGELRHALASVMVSAGDPEGALGQFGLALEDPGVDPGQVGREMFEAGYLPERILDSMPARFQAQHAAGGLLLTKGYPDLAETAFRAASDLSPDAHEPPTALCRLAEGQGRHEEALEWARKVLPRLQRLAPRDRSALLLCAATASRSLGSPQDALSYGARALDENPQDLFLYNFMASLLFAGRDYEGAIRYWQSLLDEHGDDPYVERYAGQFERSIGASYAALGDRERAMRHFLEALDRDPADGVARSALERLSGTP